MIELFLILLWLFTIVVNAQIDTAVYLENKAVDHTRRFFIRLAIASFLTSVLYLNRQPEAIYAGCWLLFMGLLFWWLFDSLMGLSIYGNITAVGGTSWLDKIQRKLKNPLVIWAVKFFLMFIPLSYYINYILS